MLLSQRKIVSSFELLTNDFLIFRRKNSLFVVTCFFLDKAFLVFGEELHEMVEKDSLKIFLKMFAVDVKERYVPVVLHLSFIAFPRDWRESGLFLVLW